MTTLTPYETLLLVGVPWACTMETPDLPSVDEEENLLTAEESDFLSLCETQPED